MSGITSGIGLVSGINSTQIIEQLLALEGRGKLPIQARYSQVQASKTALLDVNARLLNLRNSASKLRLGNVFTSMTATSADETSLAARASKDTPPGTYQFTVGRLVSTSQILSRGFATKDATPLGLDNLSFEWGDAGLERDLVLSDLRGGEGISRGKITIRDGLGREDTIDLSTAVTLGDVMARINAANNAEVDAYIENERLVISDESGGPGSLIIADVGSGLTAEQLGIRGTHTSQEVTGAQLNQLGLSTALASLNDGTGVFVRDNVVDFRIKVDGTTYDISLGREDQPIANSTKLSDLNNGLGIKINTTDADDFKVVTSTGVTVGINLGAVVVDGEVQDDAVETVGQMLTRINAELEADLGAGQVVVSLRSDGKGFVVTDSMGGSGPVKVLGSGPNLDRTAKDLGIFTGAIDSGPTTLTGNIVRNKVATPRASTIEDIIARISDQTSNAVTASIASGGTGLTLSVAGGSTVEVLAGTTDGSSFGATVGERTARDLGLFGLSGTGSVTSTRIAAAVGTVRTARLFGGQGLGTPGTLTLTDRNGNAFDFTNFAAHDTVAGLIRAINTDAKNNGVDVRLEVSDSGRGLLARDVGDGNGTMSISGSAATSLGIAGSIAGDAIRGSDLDRQHLTLGTKLSSLAFGKGVGTGTFRITDSSGDSAIVDIDATASTIYDVMSEINSRGLFVEARLNATGDGIELVDTNTGTASNAIKVADVSGAVAKGIGLVGQAASAGANLIGSLEKTVDLETTDTLADVVRKLNDAKIPVAASIVNAGSGTQPFRLSISSIVGGTNGQLLMDTGSVDLGMVRTSEGRDASLFLGTGDPATAFLYTSATNTFKDVVSGLEVDAKKAGATVSVDVARDVVGMVEGVKQLVTTVNDALGRIGEYDKYDDETKKKGPLLGNPVVARVRQQLIQTAQGPAKGVEGRYRFLSQVGIRFGKEGQLQFDEAKFRAAYDTDPAAVEELFTAFEIQSTSSNSPVAGVTVEQTTTTYSKLGFGDLFDQLLKKLTNSVDGVTTVADRGLQSQLDGLKDRLDRFDARLETKRQRYLAQFSAMESTLARLQTQQSSLGSLSANVAMIG
ncbi:MAG: flagellar filament capping protein FliD [Limnohabitans sp.]|nr:flagellar filament capping protein FliD [Limnohabitans sp.]